MAYFAGLDVSVKETSVCIVDDAGKIVREARVASEPEALLQVLPNTIQDPETTIWWSLPTASASVGKLSIMPVRN